MQIEAAAKVLEEAAFRPNAFAESFPVVASLLDARTFHMTHDPGFGPPDFVLARENQPILEAYLKDNWNLLDIWTENCRRLHRRGIHDVHIDSLVVPSEVRKTSAFFQEFYPAWDIAHVACWCFVAGGDDLGFTIKRSRGRPFTESDVTSLQSFRRVANRVALLVSQFHRHRIVGFLQGLEASGRATMALNHLGEISYLTPAAETLAGDAFCVRQRVPYGVTPRSDAGFVALRKWIRQRNRGLPASFMLDRVGGRRPIAAVPVAVPDDSLIGLPFARVIVMLLDLSKSSDLPSQHLREMFGFTNREADVASLLACGDDVNEISEKLNLKVVSTRQVIKAVLAKAGVRRQTELVAMLSKFR